jgi:transcriptional regulator with XRE-family HTH domain
MALKTKKVNAAFGQRLAEVREAAGLTQAGLAEKGGIPLGTIRELEQGRREPLFSNMQKLAAALNVSLDGWPAAALPDDQAPKRKGRRTRKAPGGA